MRDDAPKAVTAIGLALQEQIEHGLLPPSSKLPAERKLSELFNTTRITVREALLQLEAQGLVYREERRGWFISPPRLAYDLMRRSHFHAMVGAQGRVAETLVISARLQPASAQMCGLLQLPAFSSVIQICRARRIDQRLVLYVEHYLNPEYFPQILDFDLNQSLTELYASHYGIRYGKVRFEMVPTALQIDAAAALKVSLGSPGLRIERVNHDQQGRLIDCDIEYWRHDAIHVSAVVEG
ncbi:MULTISPECIES: UTRA domain-containing protein [unclassified Pseudomonas]|uniref:UTRA domain-containing protein n=1 Tax=unclassified Pseudomonas TaxID=196821 RepID=UPI002AC8B061|nr:MULTISPECIES: UTRA domain-containing protein [unclassified Pseudomonas]MEB0042355.1 UTRA domain-containing protein [Pseudomonas sp. MH10]MEB0078124.1 UTRA domain-containing protein [Pseudomonas sp. MH10out]MEB0094293.1 UTRA domain-containing protein [Pseudomonas sp. CCI4.2]MEB0100536.1 UTRA domain-containing protein [Pseudomonas sp. CCI3.2]MEB0123861.1 UTRA domain-containing protein [Pseudomonas sp. CCI1.2]